MKTKHLIIIIALLCGCARFTTKQTDIRYDENGQLAGEISTKATATTFWESKSALANFKASQSEKTQSAVVGGLVQEGGGTNTAATLKALVELLNSLK